MPKEEVKKILRNKCPACGSESRKEFKIAGREINLPILPICVDTSREEDILFPIKLVICENCGLLYLSEVIDPEYLYNIFHSEAIGGVWEGEFDSFSEVIKNNLKAGKILEVGAGTGKLVKRLQSGNFEINVIDPSYAGPTENIKVHKKLFSEEFASEFPQAFDSIISEHTIEHFLEFQEYFKNAFKCLKPGGLLFTSVPNQEYFFIQGQTNQINLEHTSLCTNLHWIHLHMKHGFFIKDISLYQGHSLHIVAQKKEDLEKQKLNTKEFSASMLTNFERSIAEKLNKIKKLATPDKENWIFGAANTTQWLFALGLDETLFKGLFDNSEIKREKRLYGTNLITHKPEDIIKQDTKNLRVFLNLAHYNSEVQKQVKEINPEVECISL
jgi:2-polyprenyl-3-methyl-5-hydroxy-6-metoxy-1,4-benzoquinol methylase